MPAAPHVPLARSALPKLAIPRLGLASFRRRIIFRGVFVLLAAATLALALLLLKEEKQRSYEDYGQAFRKTRAEIMARLRHPSGQLALLNPTAGTGEPPLRPLVLPYAGLDFDDRFKVQQAIELAGCSVQYPDGGSVCVAVGNNAYAGGFIYLAGSFPSGALVPRRRGSVELQQFHHAVVTLDLEGQVTRWIAPFETVGESGAAPTLGRLTGFEYSDGRLPASARPVRDFRGWLWQNGPCTGAGESCRKRAFFSIRLPVEAFRAALFQQERPVWPPPNLDQVRVRIEMFAPGSEHAVFDSNAGGASAPPSLGDLAEALLPGESLSISGPRQAASEPPAPVIAVFKGKEAPAATPLPWLTALVHWIPAPDNAAPLAAHDVVATAAGDYQVGFLADPRSMDAGIAAVATRMSWFVGAMLIAITLAWLVIEVGLIRRIAVLTKRAAALSYNVNDPQVERRIGDLDVSDLRGRDELGILAGGLADLLQRVKDDVKREHIRTAHERDMWHAVGHEIMSPLQSLMVLHGESGDPSRRYVKRMQQAVQVLYGSAPPSEALQAAALHLGALELNGFLEQLAANASFAGIDGVEYRAAAAPIPVRADEYSLEDVITHILRNADRCRSAGTAIVISLRAQGGAAEIDIHNRGPAIDPSMLDRIFEYGVSGAASADDAEHRGQGLFVARTYMAKMGGTVRAVNTVDGVSFVLSLQRAPA
jgi:signal transduction histidine kinase